MSNFEFYRKQCRDLMPSFIEEHEIERSKQKIPIFEKLKVNILKHGFYFLMIG